MRETLAIEDPDISTHAPRTGSDAGVCRKRHGDGISTHAPRTGSDPPIFRGQAVLIYFNPRSPHGERPPFRRLVRPLRGDFNPRSPHGERPPASGRGRRCSGISTHAPRTGSDVVVKVPICRAAISTHAPRTGSDTISQPADQHHQHFNPRSPHGERPSADQHHQPTSYFNPRSPHGERLYPATGRTSPRYFNPRSPHGERPDQHHQLTSRPAISTHAPRTGSDVLGGVAEALMEDFNPRSPHGERQAGVHRTAQPIHHFNPRSPHGERRKAAAKSGGTR